VQGTRWRGLSRARRRTEDGGLGFGQPGAAVPAGEVPAGADDRFIAAWEAARDFLAAQDGYRSTALHRALSPDAEFRFVNIGRYASTQAFQAAIGQPGFRQAAAAIQGRAHPGLYEVIRR
jgi:heme oxygenase (mycobilin-producing)